MFKNYVKIAIRNLLKRKTYSLINVFGLAVGVGAFILIGLLVYNEMTYDTFHQNADHIFLIHRLDKSANGEQIEATTPDPLAETLKNDYPDIANVVRFFGNEFPVTANGRTFTQRILATTPAVFQMFTFPLLRGDPKTALENVHSVVITPEVASKFFGDDDPMGQTLTLFGKYEFVVTAIVQKIPQNSSIRFGMLIPEVRLREVIPEFGKQWHSSGSYTFVQLSANMTPMELANQLPRIIEKYVPDWYKGRIGLGMQPLTSIHLSTQLEMALAPTTSPKFLYLLFGIGLAVLLIACINFMNLSTARHSERAKEISMRRIVGASRMQLIQQLLGESILMSFAALFLGLGLAELLLPEFNALTGKQLALVYGNNFLALVGLIAFGLFLGIFAGIYPAFFLTSQRTVEVLKGQQKTRRHGLHFRRTLVIAQFAISTALIIAVLVITQQLRYMRHHDLGFKPENMVVIPTHADDLRDPLLEINAYMNAIEARKTSAGIVSATLSEHVPGFYFSNIFGVVPDGGDTRNPLEMIVTSIDEYFLAGYRMQLVAGRNFSSDISTDRDEAVLLNETAARRLGWDTAVGKHLRYAHGDGPFTVIGVVKDIHFKSLQTTIEPQVYRFAAWPYQMGFLSVRLQPEEETRAIAFLQDTWRQVVNDMPFEYFFVADKYAASYRGEERILEIIGVASLLTILLACVGLLGLVALAVSQRTKEIGIRKVLGATVSDLLLLLSRQLATLVLAANLMSWPIAYYFMRSWLQAYPYRIDMGMAFYLLGSALALLIALLAVGSQAIKAALANPVDALRYE